MSKKRVSKFQIEILLVPLLMVLRDKGFLTEDALRNINAKTIKEIGKKVWLMTEQKKMEGKGQ